ncbi:MAG: rRNA pseudouridine synthase [Bacilli bacterium]|nr:rRNA pseudouridine synthase [Bacilli bacterium]
MERLQKIIAECGYCSRRKAEELIMKGKVKVNGIVISQLGYKANMNDAIEVNGELLNNKEDYVYFLLNKPRGIITSTSDEKNRKTVIDLINCDKRIYPVGRLDYDTTGVLLLTNDGNLANYLMHPSHNIEKIYVAKIEGILTKEDIISLEKGVIIDGKKTSKSKVKIIKVDKKSNVSIVKIMIHEGRNHQVKKMFNAVGYNVIKLKRESFAFLTCDGLKSGEYRMLSIKEVKMLYSLIKKTDV